MIDADSLCMCKLPFKNFDRYLKEDKFCAASDPKCEANTKELENNFGIRRYTLYFNSGVCFWKKEAFEKEFKKYKEWVLVNFDELKQFSYADQTWMNIFMNKFYSERLAEIGWYWNFRGCIKHPRAYIWHAGGRGSRGIECLKEEFNSWEKK